MTGMKTGNPIEPFHRSARRRVRDRAAGGFGDFAFLKAAIAEELAARAASFERRWTRVLDLGAHDGTTGRAVSGAFTVFADSGHRFAHLTHGVQCDEDRLPFADHSFDLIVSAGALNGVNDLPGALIQARRTLKPGGVFLAGFVGGASLADIRHAMIESELADGDGASVRLHPMVDAREAPALMQRAGFADPVVDTQQRVIRYGDAAAMLRDLRGMGESNILAERERQPLGRRAAGTLSSSIATLADEGGRIPAHLELIFLTGRSV